MFANSAATIDKLCNEWLILTQEIGKKAQANMDEVGAAAFDYLMYAGYVSLAHIHLQMASAAQCSDCSDDFKTAKLQTLNFYMARILPRTKMHKAAILSGNDNLQSTEFTLD